MLLGVSLGCSQVKGVIGAVAPSAIVHSDSGTMQAIGNFLASKDVGVFEIGATYDFSVTIINHVSGDIRIGTDNLGSNERAITSANGDGTFTGQLTIPASVGSPDFTWRSNGAGFVGTIAELKAERVS